MLYQNSSQGFDTKCTTQGECTMCQNPDNYFGIAHSNYNSISWIFSCPNQHSFDIIMALSKWVLLIWTGFSGERCSPLVGKLLLVILIDFQFLFTLKLRVTASTRITKSPPKWLILGLATSIRVYVLENHSIILLIY